MGPSIGPPFDDNVRWPAGQAAATRTNQQLFTGKGFISLKNKKNKPIQRNIDGKVFLTGRLPAFEVRKQAQYNM